MVMTANSSTSSQGPGQKASPRPILALLVFLLICYGVAALGSVFSSPSIPTWYAALAKPTFNPPNWVFAPVWTLLYSLMALAAWLVWRTPATGHDAANRRTALILFTAQLVLNALWTPVFFTLHLLLHSLIVLIALWLATLLTTLSFQNVHRLAAILLLPYLAWITFAMALNYEIYRLN
jgi:translocator protein